MEQITRRDRVLADLRHPADVVRSAWPRSPGGRRLAAVLAPVAAVLVIAVLWVFGVVVLSALAAVGVEPVDLEGSDHYVRDGVLFLGTGALAAVGLSIVFSLWRAAIDGGPAPRR